MAVTFARRLAVLACSVAAASPTQVHAARTNAAPASALQRADDLNREAIELRSQAEPLVGGEAERRRQAAELLERAAHKWHQAAGLLPTSAPEARRDLYCDAAAAWQQAHALDPSRVQALRDGLAASEEHSQGPPLVRGCSPQSYVGQFTEALAQHEAAARPAPEPAPVVPATTSTSEPAQPRRASGERPTRGLAIGLWTSLGLTVAWGAVAVGTGLAVAHERRSGAVDPSTLYMGPAYRRVFSEARALGLHGADRDLCAADSFAAARDMGADPEGLQDACADFGRLRNTAIAGAVIAGVSLVSTAVLAGVYGKRRNAARGRLGVLGGPIRGGVVFGASLRF